MGSKGLPSAEPSAALNADVLAVIGGALHLCGGSDGLQLFEDQPFVCSERWRNPRIMCREKGAQGVRDLDGPFQSQTHHGNRRVDAYLIPKASIIFEVQMPGAASNGSGLAREDHTQQVERLSSEARSKQGIQS